MTISIIFSIFWYLVGVVSFTYWYTKDNDFAVSDLGTLFSLAFYGRVIFFIGWIIHNNPDIQYIQQPKTKILISNDKFAISENCDIVNIVG